VGLSPSAIDELVAKHKPGPEENATARETMISQEDIDALVQQLSSAVGGEPAPADAAGRKPGSTSPPRPATPAAQPATLAMTATGASGEAPGALVPAGAYPVLAPGELRGARWLLVAAVVLLATCAVAMGAVREPVTTNACPA